VPRLSSLTQAATALASLLSPMLGVALYSVMGFSWFIYLEISSQFLVLLLLLSLHFYYESPLHAFVQKKSTSAWQNFRVGSGLFTSAPFIAGFNYYCHAG